MYPSAIIPVAARPYFPNPSTSAIPYTRPPAPSPNMQPSQPHPQTPACLPAVGLVPYLNTLTITKEQHSMVPNHIATPYSMNTDLIAPWRKSLPPSTSLITCAAFTAVPLGASFFLLWWASMIYTSNPLLLKVNCRKIENKE